MKRVYKYIAYGVMAVLVLLMMAATIVERLYGSPVALRWFYHNPLFIGLWAVVAVSGMEYLVRLGTYKRVFTMGIHVSLVIILAGALVTHLFGESGEIHPREGEPAASFTLDDDSQASLPFSVRLESFAIDYYPETTRPSDYRSVITFFPEGAVAEISMNHIAKYKGYRLYQADFDEDGKGSILAVSHDPWGVGITYAGYLLLLLSMIGFFFQKDTSFREALSALRRKEPRNRSTIPVAVGTFAALALWVFLTVVIVRRWIASGTGPFVGQYNVMLLMAWFSTLAVLLLIRRFPPVAIPGFLLTGLVLFMAFRSQGGREMMPLMPVLRSPLLSIHVFSIILSYTLFGLVAINGIVGVTARKRETRIQLKDWSLSILYPAVCLLTFGTFLGAVWANNSWGNYWAWDPKETWALVTMLVYSFALHGKVLKPFRHSRSFHWFTIIAFFCVIVTYFGVNLILGGIHSYS